MNRLQSMLDHAGNTVPYYSRLRQTQRPGTDLAAFPAIGKKQFSDNLEAMFSREYDDYVRISASASGPHHKVLICEFTSGSSGYPLRCYKTVRERTELALSLYKKRKAIYPGFSNAQMFGFIHNTAYESNSYTDSLGNLSDENIEKVLRYLRDTLRPAVLHGNTMLFLYYADFIRKYNFDLKTWRIAFIESVSESISAAQKEYIGAQFKTTVYNCYGCLECYNIAYECPQQQLHQNENVWLQILDPDTGADITGEAREGEVVLTSLVNRAQPFIKYKTGDIGYLTAADCACGNPGRIVHLSGRRKIDYIKLLYKSEDSKLNICGYDMFATVMYRLVTGGHDYVSWYNVIQKELDRFAVLYIKKQGFSADFFRLFQQYAEEELGMPVKLEFNEKNEQEALLINRKNRVFRSLLQAD